MTTLFDNVELMLLAGINCVPVGSNKKPLIKWHNLTTESLNIDEAGHLFTTAYGVAAICGKISGNLEAIDFDAHGHDAKTVFNTWMEDDGVRDIIKRRGAYIESTPSGGVHVVYQCESEVAGSQVLARWDDKTSKIETRGEGGYIIIAPTPGYMPIFGNILKLTPITEDERQYLLTHCINFNDYKGVVDQTTPLNSDDVPHDYTDPINWFNAHKAGYAKQLLKDKGWTYIRTHNDVEEWRRPGKLDGISATWGYKYNAFYVFSTSALPFKNGCYYTPFQILTLIRFKRDYRAAISWIMGYYFKEEESYLRIGADYFKKIKKIDRFNVLRTELKLWKKDEIKLDKGAEYLKKLPQFDDFIIYPDNINHMEVVANCYNLYKPFAHTPVEGSWDWSRKLLQHIFGEQYSLGLRYMQALYLHPDRQLPILVLVSKQRQTGKTTFINWMSMIFGSNMALITPEDLLSTFNASYVTKNIIAIEESFFEKAVTVEKIKALVTSKNIMVNQKFVSPYTLPFYGKLILTSNNEDRFAKIDDDEIRFFIRKVPKPAAYNHNIEKNLLDEIPAFLHYLTSLPPIDWTADRTGFTPDELNNTELESLKIESRSWLHKELTLLFTELFDDHPQTVEFVHCSAADIKDIWFKNNSRVEINYISRVLKHEMKLTQVGRVIRYQPLGLYTTPQGAVVNSKTTNPFTVHRSLFAND